MEIFLRKKVLFFINKFSNGEINVKLVVIVISLIYVSTVVFVFCFCIKILKLFLCYYWYYVIYLFRMVNYFYNNGFEICCFIVVFIIWRIMD